MHDFSRHPQKNLMPLDDLPGGDLALVTIFAKWIRHVGSPWFVQRGSFQHRIAMNMARCGVADLRADDEIPGAVSVELVRRRAA